MLKNSSLLLVCCFVSFASLAQTPSKPSFSVVPPQVARGLRGQAGPEVEELLNSAAAAAMAEPHAVVRVHLEGTLPTDSWYRESWDSSRDWIKMMQLAMAYRISGDRSYLIAEQRYLDAWLAIYKISFNPIDETPLDQVMVAYDLTRDQLPERTRQSMRAFLDRMARGYINAIESEKTEDTYNWQSHRIKLALLASYGISDASLIEKSIQLLRHHLEGNLLPGSVVIDFGKRDALHYTVYDLEPLAMAGLALRSHDGPDLFLEQTRNGASLKAAVDWLAPYAEGRKKHEEFVHSTATFDAARAKAGVHGYSGEWDPTQSLLLYAIVSNLSPSYLELYQRIRAASHCHTHDWLILLERSGL